MRQLARQRVKSRAVWAQRPPAAPPGCGATRTPRAGTRPRWPGLRARRWRAWGSHTRGGCPCSWPCSRGAGPPGRAAHGALGPRSRRCTARPRVAPAQAGRQASEPGRGARPGHRPRLHSPGPLCARVCVCVCHTEVPARAGWDGSAYGRHSDWHSPWLVPAPRMPARGWRRAGRSGAGVPGTPGRGVVQDSSAPGVASAAPAGFFSSPWAGGEEKGAAGGRRARTARHTSGTRGAP